MAKKRSASKVVTLKDIQEKLGKGKGSRSSAAALRSSAQKKYDKKWDKFEKKTLKKVDKDIKKTIKEMKKLAI